jgi:hypothetical protein
MSMPDAAVLLDLIREHGLDRLPVISKDPLAVHAHHFADALRAYETASAAAFAAGELSRSADAADHYQLAAMLYAPGLVAALAKALLDAEGGK